MGVGYGRDQQKSKIVKLQHRNNGGNIRPDKVEADGKGGDMN